MEEDFAFFIERIFSPIAIAFVIAAIATYKYWRQEDKDEETIDRR
jgi:hypothetical protein